MGYMGKGFSLREDEWVRLKAGRESHMQQGRRVDGQPEPQT